MSAPVTLAQDSVREHQPLMSWSTFWGRELAWARNDVADWTSTCAVVNSAISRPKSVSRIWLSDADRFSRDTASDRASASSSFTWNAPNSPRTVEIWLIASSITVSALSAPDTVEMSMPANALVVPRFTVWTLPMLVEAVSPEA